MKGRLERKKANLGRGFAFLLLFFLGGLVAVATFAASFAAVAFAAVAATAAAAGLGFEFFGGGVADGDDVAFEAYIFACEGMVEVHFDIGVGDFGHDAVDAEAVGGHHGEDGTGLNDFFVDLAIDFEDVEGEGDNLFGVAGAKCFVGFNDDVEQRACFKAVDCLFEGADYALCYAENDFFGIFNVGLMYEFLTFGGHFVEIIAEVYIFSGFDFFQSFVGVYILYM